MQQNVSAAFPIGTTVISERHVTSGTILNQGTTSTTDNLLNRGTQFATTGTTGNKLTGNYPTVTFRPLEAKFIKDKDFIGKMDPYCKFKIGWHSEKSSVAKSQGTNPVWAGDVITLKRKHNEEFVKIKLKDSDTLTMDDRLGDVKLRLDDLAMKGKVNQWFTLEKRGKATGEILLDIEYHNGPSTGFNAPNTGFNAPTTGFTAPNTGFNAPNTGFNAPNTGFNAPTTGFVAPTTGFADQRVASNLPYNTAPGTLPTTVGVLPTAGTLPHTAGTTPSHGIINGKHDTVTFRPIEGKFLEDKDLIGKMDPYCKFKIGWHTGKSSVAKNQGVHPVWSGDAVTLKRKHGKEFAKIKIKDKDMLINDRLGSIKINLNDLAAKGRISQWFPVEKRGKMTGEVLMEIDYNSAGGYQTGLPTGLSTGANQVPIA